MSATIRNIKPGDFPDLISMFREFALFQKEPEKMINTVDHMRADQELVKGFTAESDNGELVGYVTYFFTYHTWSGKSMRLSQEWMIPSPGRRDTPPRVMMNSGKLWCMVTSTGFG